MKENILPGGIAEAGSGFVGTIDNIPGVTLKVLSAGTISGGVALAGNLVEVLSGGLVSGLTFSSGATEIVVFFCGFAAAPPLFFFFFFFFFFFLKKTDAVERRYRKRAIGRCEF